MTAALLESGVCAQLPKGMLGNRFTNVTLPTPKGKSYSHFYLGFEGKDKRKRQQLKNYLEYCGTSPISFAYNIWQSKQNPIDRNFHPYIEITLCCTLSEYRKNPSYHTYFIFKNNLT